jgi:hypothetical protein
MPEVEFVPRDQTALQRAFLETLYEQRPCAICGKFAWCRHREPMVDLAEHTVYMSERKRARR